MKVTFGLQPEHLEIIEKYMTDIGSSDKVWEIIGKKIGWHPLTAAAHYIRHLQAKAVPAVSMNESVEFLQWALGNCTEKDTDKIPMEFQYDGTWYDVHELLEIFRQNQK